MKHIILTILIVSAVSKLSAQQTPMLSQYYLNPFLLNPAFAGLSDQTNAFLTYRKQWTGIVGAPETQAFTIDGELSNEKMGLGLTFINDVSNIIGRANLLGTYAYHLSLSDRQRLSAGISLGILQNRVYFDRINADNPTDPNLLTELENRTVVDGTLGINYSYDAFNLGFAVAQMFQNQFEYENTSDFKELGFGLVRHYTVMAKYVYEANDKFKIEPIVLMRVAQGLSPQYDFTVSLKYFDKIWAAVSYRTQIGTNFSLGMTIDEKFVVSYAYEVPSKKIRGIAEGSHEFTLGIRLNKTRGVKRPIDIDNQAVSDSVNYNINTDIEERLDEQDQAIEQMKDDIETYKEDLKRLIFENGVNLSDPGELDTLNNYYMVVGVSQDIEEAKNLQKKLKREAKLDTRVVQSQDNSWFLLYTGQPESIPAAKGGIKLLQEQDIQEVTEIEPWIYKESKKEKAEKYKPLSQKKATKYNNNKNKIYNKIRKKDAKSKSNKQY